MAKVQVACMPCRRRKVVSFVCLHALYRSDIHRTDSVATEPTHVLIVGTVAFQRNAITKETTHQECWGEERLVYHVGKVLDSVTVIRAYYAYKSDSGRRLALFSLIFFFRVLMIRAEMWWKKAILLNLYQSRWLLLRCRGSMDSGTNSPRTERT